MFRNNDSLHLDDLVEFYRDDQHVFYVGRRVNANPELVCDGMNIDAGGNSPDDECTQIVSAACRAFEDTIGFGSTKCVSFFEHAQRIRGDGTALARADIEVNEDDIPVEVGQSWIDRSLLPPGAEILLAAADEAFDVAWAKEVAAVEAQHNEQADKWARQCLSEIDGFDKSLRAIANGDTCASSELATAIATLVDAFELAMELAEEVTA